MPQWSNFFFLCGSCASGLFGLMFISLTFGAKIVKTDNLDKVDIFYSSVCYHFMQVFLLCCVGSIPIDDCHALGAVSILSGLWRVSRIPGIYRSISALHRENKSIELFDWLVSMILPMALYLYYFTAGVAFLMELPWAAQLFAYTLISQVLLGMRAAWDMLVWTAAFMKKDEEGRVNRP